MKVDLLLILFVMTLISGLIWLVDTVFWLPSRRIGNGRAVREKQPLIAQCAKLTFPVVLVVFLLRSFVFQHFYVPSNSLAPSIIAGDNLLVNEFIYGLRMPIWHKKIFDIGSPKRGDIAVFYWPVDPSIMIVKRIVGLPGDQISYIDKTLYINGKKAEKIKQSNSVKESSNPFINFQENLSGKNHNILINQNKKADNFYNVRIPAGHYFVLGDNRDDSEDSRFWGVVPDKYIIGKAFRIIGSWDHTQKKVRWSRFGKKI